jgi:hypothetical protein
MGIEFERNEGGQVHFQNLTQDAGRLVRRFSKDETGQYHFLDIVLDNGMMYEWPGWSGVKSKVDRISIGPPRPSLDELLERFDIPFERLGIDLNESIVMMGSEFYPSGEELLFVNKDTGFVNTEIFYEELPRDDDASKREYKPVALSQHLYKFATLKHPIIEEKIDGVAVESCTWDIDSKFRRRSRNEIGEYFFIYDEDWDPSSGKPRISNQILIESEFEVKQESENTSVTIPIEFTEKYRTYIFPEEMFIYCAMSDPPRMVFLPKRTLVSPETDQAETRVVVKDSYKVGKRIIRREEIPVELGEPRKLMF